MRVRYYYYHVQKDVAIWKRPAPLMWRDLDDVARVPRPTGRRASVWQPPLLTTDGALQAIHAVTMPISSVEG